MEGIVSRVEVRTHVRQNNAERHVLAASYPRTQEGAQDAYQKFLKCRKLVGEHKHWAVLGVTVRVVGS